MHIPASMLHGEICPVTLMVAGVSVLAAAKMYSKSENKISPQRWAGVTAFIFAMQMLNFPVVSGTSGHLVGGVLAASLLGIPVGILSMAMILFVQAAFFADGGMNALGANVINMGVIGVGLGGVLFSFLKARKFSQTAALALASGISVIVAAFSCSVQVALSGTVGFGAIAKAMLPVHVLIGVGEGILTVVLWRVLSALLTVKDETKIFLRLGLCSLLAVVCAPWASRLPDGLESAALKLNVTFSSPDVIFNSLGDYQALIGIAVIWSLTWIMAKRYAS